MKNPTYIHQPSWDDGARYIREKWRTWYDSLPVDLQDQIQATMSAQRQRDAWDYALRSSRAPKGGITLN